MKKKLAIISIMGAVMVGMTACGSASDTETASETSTEVTTETDSTDSSEVERVADRDDYIKVEDLDIDKYITLASYDNLSVSAVKPETDDASVESYINSYLLVGNITDRAVESGDIVSIDFVGKKDGVEFDGGSATDYTIVIGSGTFIDGFEDGLIGVMPGDTVDLDLTFPDDYASEDLAGQEVVFTVTVNYISATAEYSTVTVEEMKSMGLEYESLEELWDEAKSALDESNEETYISNVKSAILEKLTEDSEFIEVPEWLVDEQIQDYILYLDALYQYWYGIDFETYVTSYAGITVEEAQEEMRDDFEETVKQFLVIEAIARAEGIEMTYDDVYNQAGIDCLTYGYGSADALLEDSGYTSYRMYLLQDKVFDKLIDMVEVTVESETSEE